MTAGMRIFARLATLVALFLLAGVCGYKAYLAADEGPDLERPPVLVPAPARRAVVFVIDAFHPARARDPGVMPNLVRLAAEGASGIVKTGPVSITAPCIFTLMTGRPGDLVRAVFNFHAGEVRGPSVPRAVVRSGRRIALAGDKTWGQQFGWLAESADRHVSPELGITLDPRITDFDREAVEFLRSKLDDRGFGLLVVHVASTDAIGHIVTPYAERYFEQLRLFDGLLGALAEAAGREDTVLLVTGDHGMGARGSHGGAEEEARLTPYVLRGPGVRAGIVADVDQSALAPTLAVLLGLPLPVVSEQPPAVELLAISPEAARQMTESYFGAKAAAAGVPASAGEIAGDDRAVNEHLNLVLFGSGGSRLPARALMVLVTGLGVAVSLAMCGKVIARRSGAWTRDVLTAALPLFMFAFAGSVFLRPRLGQNLSYQVLVAGIDATTVMVAGSGGVLLLGRWRERLGRLRPGLFFAAAVIASAPLLGSPWRSPARFFEALLLVAMAIMAIAWRSRLPRWAPVVLLGPVGLAILHYLPGSDGAIPQWVYLSPLTIAIVGLAGWNLSSAGRVRGTLAFVTICVAFAASWAWRAHPVPPLAAMVLAASLASILAATFMAEPLGAATLVIGGSAALFLMMADFGREALVFLAAGTGALIAARGRLDLSHLKVVYATAAVAILLRLCLFFQLGDEYMLSAIRTSAGFRLVDFGLPLATVIALMVLKYTLPWLIILAAVLPSLARSSRQAAREVVLLIALGYVARLALVAALADPLRMITDGVQVLVGIFCISWAEFVTFVLAATLTVLLIERSRSATPMTSVRP